MTDPKINGEQRGKLLRVLGVGFGLAVIIGNTIGAGIFRTPGDIAEQLPHPWLVLGVWVVGGAYALLGAFSLALSHVYAMLTPAVKRSGTDRARGKALPSLYPCYIL